MVKRGEIIYIDMMVGKGLYSCNAVNQVVIELWILNVVARNTYTRISKANNKGP